MRPLAVRRLTVQNYGHFGDETFAFREPPPEGPDLHIVVGRNEAGKTTLKHALADALFGIPSASPYAFAGVKRVRLDAQLSVDGDAVQAERIGRKALVPPDAELALKAATGDMTRGTFLGTQAFSHDEMRLHSHMLYRAEGDLRELLMASAGGLEGAESLLEDLKAREKERFVARANNKSNAFRKALDLLRAAEADYHSALLSGEAHRELERQVERKDAELSRLRQDECRLAAEDARLRALIAVEPAVTRLDALEADDNPDAPRLAPSAEERVAEARRAADREDAAIASADEMIVALNEERAALERDPAVLQLAAELEALAERRGIIINLADERRAAAYEAAGAEREAMRLAAELGFGDDDADALAKWLPNSLVAQDVRRRLTRRAKLEQEAETARERLAAIPTEPPEVPSPPGECFDKAIAALDGLGDPREAFAEAQRRCREADASLDGARAASAADIVARCEPPSAEEGSAIEATIGKTRERWIKAADQLADAEAEVASLTARLAAADGAIPTEDDLAVARERRDAAFDSIAQGAAITEAAPRYRALVVEADRIADTRFDNVEAIVQRREVATALAAAQQERKARADHVEACRSTLEAQEKAWAERLRAVGLDTVPAPYGPWHDRRARLVAAEQEARDAANTRDALAQRVRTVIEKLQTALGEDHVGPANADLLPELARMARKVRNEAKRLGEAAALGEAQLKSYREAVAARPDRESALAAAEAALTYWRAAWRPFAESGPLPVDGDPEAVDAILIRCSTISDQLKAFKRSSERVRMLDEAEAAFALETKRLAAQLGAPMEGGPINAAALMRERLLGAQRTEDRLSDLNKRLRDVSEERAKRVRAREEIVARLAADFADAGLAVADMTALMEAARASDRARGRAAERSERLLEIVAHGFEWPAVREALAAATPDERRAALSQAEAELSAVRARIGAVQQERGAAENARRTAEANSATGTAAQAKHRAARLTGELSDIAAEAISLRLRIAVMTAARNRFAAKNRSPILSSASAIFARFTGGAFSGLQLGSVGDDEGFVVAVRADGSIVDVPALSDGTRDQLVIAVRLAAAARCPLPFLADDLFVNADDDRARFGFHALADLAAGRQVIYLTHHAHLVPLALDAAGGSLNVIDLSSQTLELQD